MKFNSKDYHPGIIWIHGADSEGNQLLVQQYSINGNRIILSGFDRDKLYHLKSSCKGNPMNIHILLMNSKEADELLNKTKEALRIFGRIDTLIICHTPLAITETKGFSTQRLKEDIDNSFWPAISLIQATLPILTRQQSGHIVLMNSMASQIGLPNQVADCTVQHALTGYLSSLRSSLAPTLFCSLIIGEVTNDKMAKGLIRKLKKVPPQVVLNKKDRLLLRLKFLRPAAFFKKIRTAT